MIDNLPNELFEKVIALSNEVKNKLQKQGFAIPVKNDDGSISIGNYRIVKQDNFYSILDYTNSIVVDKINLPHTAIILANKLALGKFLDNKIIVADQKFGYALFEEQLYTHLLKKKSNIDRKDIRLSKALVAKAKKQLYKKDIKQSFEKLRKLV